MSKTNKRSYFSRSWIPLSVALTTLALLPLFLVHDRPAENSIKDLKRNGELRVLTLISPTTFYEGPVGAVGLEYDLAAGLAKELKLDLVMEPVDSVASIFPRLARGDAEFAAAGLTVTQARAHLVRFTPPYHEVRHQVVYLRGTSKPTSIEDLTDREIRVVAGSSIVQRLNELRVSHPELRWTETSATDAEGLLKEVWQGTLETTIADSDIVAISRQHFPQLGIGFSIDPPRYLAWAFPTHQDDGLFRLAGKYLKELEESGELNSLVERYYGASASFDHINLSKFRDRIDSRLPEFKDFFVAAGQNNELDWRLLAAQAYQESQWDADAVSPTGVRGIMQLTEATASLMDVKNRRDPEQSIHGGARYMVTVTKKIPERIEDPDRRWLALASYNVGFGHLEDARVITQRQGKDPDKWVDVKEHLPLLSDSEWYPKTKYGEARGEEAVAYVNRVRTFYDVLVKLYPEQQLAKSAD